MPAHSARTLSHVAHIGAQCAYICPYLISYVQDFLQHIYGFWLRSLLPGKTSCQHSFPENSDRYFSNRTLP